MDTNDYVKTQAIHDEIKALGWTVAEEYKAFQFEIFAYRTEYLNYDPEVFCGTGRPIRRWTTRLFVGDVENGRQLERSWEAMLGNIQKHCVSELPAGNFPDAMSL